MRTLLLLTCSATLVVSSSACAVGASSIGPTPGKDAGADTQTSDTGTVSDTGITSDAPVDPGCKKAAPSNVCGVSPQCGCGPTQTCEVDQAALDGTSSCVGAGSKAIATACTATSECAHGLTCIFGFCRPYCSSDGSKCAQAGTGNCVHLNDSSSSPIPNLLVCRLDCTLDNATSCGGGAGNCGPDDSGGTDCFPAGGSKTCSSSTPFACQAGYVCLTSNVCKKWCKAGSNCSSGACGSLSPAVLVGGQEYGVCP